MNLGTGHPDRMDGQNSKYKVTDPKILYSQGLRDLGGHSHVSSLVFQRLHTYELQVLGVGEPPVVSTDHILLTSHLQG